MVLSDSVDNDGITLMAVKHFIMTGDLQPV